MVKNGTALNGIQEVIGSIPFSSTNLTLIRKRDREVALFVWRLVGAAAVTSRWPAFCFVAHRCVDPTQFQ